METVVKKNKGGRPKKEIDEKMFENLCSIQCTKKEICDFFDIDEKTLTRWCKDTYGELFSEVYEKKSAKGRMSLRRIQFKLAENNTAMAIFLGKQYLGQKDVIEKQETNNGVLEDIAEALRNAKTNK